MTSSAVPDLDTAEAVLEHARDRRRVADAADADLLQDAVTWADLHPAESIAEAVRFGDTPAPVAGPGPGRRPRRPVGRGVLRGRVRGRGRAAHRDRQGLPR